MTRDTIGGVPYETVKEKGKATIRFYPRSPNAKNPNSIVFVLKLTSEDKKKLEKILDSIK